MIKVEAVTAYRSGDYEFSFLPVLFVNVLNTDRERRTSFVFGIFFWYVEIAFLREL